MATAYVSFSAEINPHTTESLIAMFSQLANDNVTDHVYLLLSTPGGDVICGMNLYNTLRGFPLRITTHNVGNVDSIGNILFLVAEERYACPYSTFMFHGVGFPINQGVRLEEKDLHEKLELVLSDQVRMGAIIGERTTLTEEEIAALFRGARTKDAASARSCGIIQEVRDVDIPEGSPVTTLVFQR